MTQKTSNALVNYFSESAQELKKITWPTKNQAFKMTLIVLGFCLVCALVIGLVDLGLNLGFQQLLNL